MKKKMLSPMEEFNKKADLRKRDADWHKRKYWELRLAVIKHLGGACPCGCDDVTMLEIHHDQPTLKGGYKNCTGIEIMREWRKILAGDVTAKLRCHDCHINGEHDGNTNALKKIKHDSEVTSK